MFCGSAGSFGRCEKSFDMGSIFALGRHFCGGRRRELGLELVKMRVEDRERVEVE